jgi:hypothetical protein
MTERDEARFAALMQGLAENFGVELSPPGIEMRFRCLAAYSIEQVEAMAMSVLSSRKYRGMPTVAEMLEHLGGGSVEDRAEVEAGKVLQAISQHGGYASVCFDDPVTQAVIQAGFGGWRRLCEEQKEADRKWFVKDFAKMYRAYTSQGVQRHGALAGLVEIDNCARGMAAPKPVLIGDEEKARLVLEHGRVVEVLERKEASCLALEKFVEDVKSRNGGSPRVSQ